MHTDKFNSYKKYMFDIGSGFSGNTDYMRMQDEKNKRILMEEQYNLVQAQKAEIVAQQKYREFHLDEILAQQKYRREQSRGARFERWLLVFNTIIAMVGLLVSLFKNT